MAFNYAKRKFLIQLKNAIILFAIVAFVFQSCKKEKKIFQSNCDDAIVFKHVGFSHLIDSIEKYDHQYIEVDGIYEVGKEESALFNDGFAGNSNGHALWINFSQDCPLYLMGTREGLFQYDNGAFTQIKNRKVTIRGKIDVRHKGHLGSYRGTIDRISFVKL